MLLSFLSFSFFLSLFFFFLGYEPAQLLPSGPLVPPLYVLV